MASDSKTADVKKSAAKSGPKAKQPKSLGKYSIQKKIGAGGMGAVFLATDTQLKRTVALKVLPKHKAENPTLVKRFKAEAQSAAHLKHDNIVTIYESGEADGFLYIALEFVDGIDVHNLVNKRGTIPVKRSVDIMKQVTRALQHAFERNIVHRDIKPANLLIRRDGTVKLADLGLARSVDETLETGITRAGTTVGTVDYMAPEQARNSKAADIRSDIYSLGCTWYHMLVGRPPFYEGSLMNKLNAHATKPPPDPRDKNPDVPDAIVAVIQRMMAKDPVERYATPAELLEELENTNLGKQAVSQNILAALADEGGEDTNHEQSTPTVSVQALPPTAARNSQPESRRQRPKFRLEPSKTLVVAAVFVACFMVLGWISSRYGSALDYSQPIAGDPFTRPTDSVNADGQSTNPASYDSTSHRDQTRNPNRSDSSRPKKRYTRRSDRSNNSQNTVARNSTDSTGSSKGSTKNSANSSNETSSNPDDQPNPRLGSARVRLPAVVAAQREGERQHFPDWVGSVEAPQQSETMVHLLKVGPGLVGPGRFTSVNTALRQLPKTGGVVQLQGNGPFFLRPVNLQNIENVVLTSSAKSRPIVILVPHRSTASEVLFKISNGSLTLDRLDLIVAARQFQTSDKLTLIAVDSGDLTVRDCSITVRGSRQGSTVAMAVDGNVDASDRTPATQSRILLDRVVVLGQSMTAMEIDQAATDLLASNCLFVTGDSPVLKLINSRPLEKVVAPKSRKKSSSETKPPPNRILRFVSSTLCTKVSAIEFNSGVESSNPPSTQVLAVNSVITLIAGQTPKPALLRLARWPQKQFRNEDESRFKDLQWMSPGSVFCGWSELIKVDDGSSLKVNDVASWRGAWNQPFDEAQFHREFWPAKSSVENRNELSPALFDTVSLESIGIAASDGGQPGCPITAFQAPDAIALARALGLADRPQAPFGYKTDTLPSETIYVDLTRQDLGKVLAEKSWPSETVVIASASGSSVKPSSPIVVRGKTLRIEFRQPKGEPLVVEPKELKATANNAFILVEDGAVEIVNGHFKIPSTNRDTIPTWFLSVKDGSFSIQNCRVVGPLLDGSRTKGLIEWTQSNTKAASDKNYGEIVDSFLYGHAMLMKADIRRRQVFLRNSILVSLSDLFELNIIGFGPEIAAAFDIQHCSLSAAKSVFKIRATRLAEMATAPLTFFVDESVFVPAVSSATRTQAIQTIFSCSQSVTEKGQIKWWGNANGFASEISQFLRTPNSDTSRQNFDLAWKKLWGETQVSRPLDGPDGVLLRVAKLPHRTKVAYTDFALHDSCKAIEWSASRTQIGADTALWPKPGASPTVAKPLPKPTKGTKRKVRLQPDF